MGMISLPLFRCHSHTPLPLDTHESTKPSGVLSSPNSLSDFSQLASSSDLAAASESLLMHVAMAEAFICAKLKHPAWKTLLSSVRWDGIFWQKEITMLKFYRFQKSQQNNAHCIIFIFLQLHQCRPNSQNLTPSSHCCLTRQPPCLACALQLPTFCLHCSLMHRQTSRLQRWHSQTLP